MILERQYEYLKDKYNVIGVFLKGSQNYNLDTETSDVDSICLICPSFDDLYSGNIITKEHEFEGNKIIIRDIRMMSNLWIKQSPNDLEILFTKYRVVAKKDFVEELDKIRDDISRINSQGLLTKCKGITISMFNRYLKTGDCKKASYVLLYADFLENFFNKQMTFGDALLNESMFNKDYIKAFKKGEIESPECVYKAISFIEQFTVEQVKNKETAEKLSKLCKELVYKEVL